ncbi:MAG: DUF6648 family protein [Ezakiella sp.]|nr:hypothetical protein [Ezakiella sp.]MDD7761847.1 hypothetical protein [Bacillota bacterium]MDY3946662.1 DUF6648 family protein [Ezakiella sp.]
MIYTSSKGLFERFFENRSYLIHQLDNGDMSKAQFLNANYEYLQAIGAKPFVKIDSMEKGMFNYQYYNIMAKYFMSTAEDIERRGKHLKIANSFRNRANDQYHKKNLTIAKMLRLVDYENVDAYYVKSKSKKLNDLLYEIVFYDTKEAIFHSTAPWLVDILKEHGCFIEGKHRSLIDSYINTKY